MSSKLEKLIAAYEAERTSLTAELEGCVAEMEYGKAHLFFKGLTSVNKQLQTLYNLKDERHDEKENRVRSIKFWEEKLAVAEGYLHSYYAQYLANEKEKLAELRQLPTQKVPLGQTVRDLLGRLLVRELTGFTLVLRDSKRLHCHIRAVRKTLFMTIPEVRRP